MMTDNSLGPGGQIEIEQVQNRQDSPPKIEAENSPVDDLSEDQKKAAAADLEARLQPVLLDAAITTIGNLLQQFTKMEAMNFSANERQALLSAWTPLLPYVSPWTNAVITTVLIIGGKGLYYAASKPKRQPKPKPSESSADTAAVEAGQLSPEVSDIKPTE